MTECLSDERLAERDDERLVRRRSPGPWEAVSPDDHE